MTKTTINTLNTLVASCYRSAEAFARDVDVLRAELKRTGVPFESKAIKQALMPATAAYYGVTLKAKERGEGFTWDMDAKGAEAAKKQNDRLAASVLGAKEKQTEEIEIPAELLKAAAALVKLANAYEGARSLASKALAAAFAK